MRIIKHMPDHPSLINLTKGKIFTWEQTTQNIPRSTFRNTFFSEAAYYNPALQYTAEISGVRSYLIKRLTPEILFSIFLTGLTCGAFFLVYENMRKQQRLVQAKDDFISNVTHELKTPVATVSVALEALKNFNAMNKPTLTQEYLDIALKELERLSHITDKILKTSVLESDTHGIPLNSVDLRDVAQSSISSLSLLAKSKDAVIHFTISGENFVLLGSHDQLGNCVVNLLDNALKYSGEKPIIAVALSEHADTIQLAISDNGIGIDAEYHGRIFEKFFRVPKGNIHTIKGHGLGLNYVYSVVKLHKGKIKVDSSPGNGSKFILTFPKRS